MQHLHRLLYLSLFNVLTFLSVFERFRCMVEGGDFKYWIILTFHLQFPRHSAFQFWPFTWRNDENTRDLHWTAVK